MNRIRTLLSMLLGLVLLAQGIAVSAAPRASLSAAPALSATVMADMPCHGQMASQADEMGEQQPSCCDENCPDMTTCALGHLASVAMVSLALPQPAGVGRGLTPVIAASRTTGSLLRPPIALHG
ncbi:hypothetical protein [Sinimarinibacterium flocculans]|jgi:hypothetical protein|uniref:CopL family metal-binding regulatory protein n=1 Tax=Sinimarinibacterium flocculans TaxID=985250 RepID=A0A318E547_9GAMM|nr:hypothetical protein C8D93_11520 [Sinimarinibacterium flocculans]